MRATAQKIPPEVRIIQIDRHVTRTTEKQETPFSLQADSLMPVKSTALSESSLRTGERHA
jgi:hypothetical protein